MWRTLFVPISIAVLTVASARSDAATVRGTVMFDGHRAQAFVAAVPMDTVTGVPDADNAVVRMTGINGTYAVMVPDGPFVLVAWDGSNGAVALSPENGFVLDLEPQERVDAIAAGGTYCTCRRMFWSVYFCCLWTDVVNLGCSLYWGRLC